MTQRNLLFLSIASVLILSGLFCKRETFRPAPYPMSLKVMNESKPIEIVAEPLKDQMIFWNPKQIESLEVEGFLDIEYKDNYYEYIQLKCIPELKCNGKNAYVPVSLVTELTQGENNASPYSAETRDHFEFMIIPSKHEEDLKKINAWLIHPEKENVPSIETEPFNSDLYLAAIRYYLDSFPAPVQERRIAEWYYLTIGLSSHTVNPAFDPYIKRYKEYDKIKAAAGTDAKNADKPQAKPPEEFSEQQKKFISMIAGFSDKEFNESLNNVTYDFPFLAKDNKSLAYAFNRKLALPLYKEKVAATLIQDASYTAIPIEEEKPVVAGENEPEAEAEEDKDGEEPETAEGTEAAEEKPEEVRLPVRKINLVPSEGLRISISGQDEFTVQSIEADSFENGLSFEIASKTGEEIKKYKLVPQKQSSYLMAARASTFEKYKKLSDEEIIGAKTPKKRMFLTALKYGTGTYDREKRRFLYTIDMSNPAVYWKVLNILKAADPIHASDTKVYSGELEFEYSDSKLRWAQHYDETMKLSQLKLHGKYTSCARECWDEDVEITCFDNTENSFIVAKFPAKSLNSNQDEPEADIVLIHEGLEGQFYDAPSLCTKALQVNTRTKLPESLAGYLKPAGPRQLAYRNMQ